MLVALTAILAAALGFAQPARAQEPSGAQETAASTEPGNDATSEAEAPPTEPASPAESPASTEPAADTAAQPADSTAADRPTEPSEAPATPPDGTVSMDDPPPADSEPAAEEPATGSSPDPEPATQTPATQTPNGASSPDAGCGATETSAANGTQTSEAPASSATACAATEPTTPSDQTTPAQQQSETASASGSPTAVQATPAAPAVEPQATATIILVVSSPAASEGQAAQPAAEVAAPGPEAPAVETSLNPDLGEGDSVALGPPDPLIVLALSRDSPVRARLLAIGGKAAARKLASCARPGARVPLSRTCTTLRAAVVLSVRLGLWPSSRTSAAALSEAGRNAARERDRHPVRRSKSERKAPPTIERAAPSDKQSKGPWASGASSAGGSSTGSGTLRIFALATTAVLPFVRPRALRAPMRSSLVPTGELGLSLPERPG